MAKAEFSFEISAPDVRHMEQYFGAWAVHEEKFNGVLKQVQSSNFAEHFAAARAAAMPAVGEYLKTESGAAIIDVIGMMTKYGSSFSAMRHGTVGVRASLRAAMKDKEVSGIVLRIDSPGGSVSGTGDLGDDIAKAAKKKPVVAYIEDMGASGAYWIASQATRVIANPGALVGSIGVYSVLYDMSAMAAQDGVKVIVVRSAEMKGAGTLGTEITPAQLQDAQRVINEIHEQFVGVIMRGRRMGREQVEQLADGRIHIASSALGLGLIDAIGDESSAIDWAITSKPSRAKTGAANMKGATAMADQEDAPVVKPATIQEIESHCKGADDAFVLKQLKANATIAQAQSAWLDELCNQNKALAEKAAALEKEKAEIAAKAEPTGVEPVGAAKGKPKAEAAGDVIGQWDDAIRAEMASGKTRQQAIRAVANGNPELHRAYIRAYNENHGRAV